MKTKSPNVKWMKLLFLTEKYSSPREETKDNQSQNRNYGNPRAHIIDNVSVRKSHDHEMRIVNIFRQMKFF